MRQRRGFTIVELLVVIGIIAILVSLILPSVSKVRERQKEVLCQMHQRTLWQAVVAFASDNDGYTVGNQFDTADPVPAHRDFLRGSDGTSTGWKGAPQAGTLWKYVRDTDTYLCPSRDHDSVQISSTNYDYLASNGHFDYAIFMCVTGAKLELLPPQARVTSPDMTQEVIPCPYLVEEAGGAAGLNSSNMEGGHANTDTLAHIHQGGIFYLGTDGAAHFYNEPAGVNVRSYEMFSVRTRKWINVGAGKYLFGWWNRQ